MANTKNNTSHICGGGILFTNQIVLSHIYKSQKTRNFLDFCDFFVFL